MQEFIRLVLPNEGGPRRRPVTGSASRETGLGLLEAGRVGIMEGERAFLRPGRYQRPTRATSIVFAFVQEKMSQTLQPPACCLPSRNPLPRMLRCTLAHSLVLRAGLRSDLHQARLQRYAAPVPLAGGSICHCRGTRRRTVSRLRCSCGGSRQSRLRPAAYGLACDTAGLALGFAGFARPSSPPRAALFVPSLYQTFRSLYVGW